MPRDLRHFHLRDLGKPHRFQAKVGGGPKRASDVPNRAAHALALLQAIDSLPNISDAELPGIYLEVKSRPNERLKKDSLDSSDLTLLHYEDSTRAGSNQESATVFATAKGVEKLRNKVEQFRTENTSDRENKDGEIIPGRPQNADLVQSVAAITEAGLRALWRSPDDKFPEDNGPADWEVWLDPDTADGFIGQAPAFGIAIGEERLHFPEDIVVVAHSTRDALASAIRRIGGVRATAAPTVTADFFDGMDVAEQAQWVDELVQRTNFPPHPDPGYVTLLDTGISRTHPLVQPALSAADRHSANPAWVLKTSKATEHKWLVWRSMEI